MEEKVEVTQVNEMFEQPLEEPRFDEDRVLKNENQAESTANSEKYAITLIMCFLVGVFGVHRFMNKKIGTGLVMLFTFGGLGIWQLYDFILLLSNNFKDGDNNIVGYQGTFFIVPVNIVVVIIFVLDEVFMLIFFALYFYYLMGLMEIIFSTSGMY